jgi:hypothetical protein
MRYWLGTVLFAMAAGWLWSALRHRSRVLAIASREAIEARRTAACADPRSISALGEIARPIVTFGLAWIGVKTAIAYAMLDAGRWLSPYDLAGFLALLAAYGTSFAFESTYRMSDAIAIRDGGLVDAPAGASADAPFDASRDATTADAARRAA